MTANLFVPILEFLINWTLRVIAHMLDQKTCCPCKKENSKSKTVQHFTEVYSGPEFELYIKIANLIMMNYVAFLYGPGMPIFFILAFAYLFLHYSVERLSMAYFYRKPPMYDNKLNNNTLFLLRLGPVIYCLMATWLFSNQQVFRNVVP